MLKKLSGFIVLSLMTINAYALFGAPKKKASPKSRQITVQEDSKNLGVDLGTRWTYVVTPFSSDHIATEEEERATGLSNIVASGPSAVYRNLKTDETLMIGKEALGQSGKEARGNEVTRVIRDGNINDIDGTCSFLKKLLDNAEYKIVGKPWIVFGVPGVVDSGSSLSIREAANRLGFDMDKVRVIEEPVAAAIGEGFDINGRKLAMVIDIGGGTTDIVIIGESGLVVEKPKKAFTVAGDHMDMLIGRAIQKKYHVTISDEQAETLKREIGAVRFKEGTGIPNVEKTLRIWDKDNRVSKKITISRADVSEMLESAVASIIQEAKDLLSIAKSDTSSAVAEKGILLVGGGSLLVGLKEAIEDEIGIEVRVPEKSDLSVAKGLGIIVGDMAKYEGVLHKPGDRL